MSVGPGLVAVVERLPPVAEDSKTQEKSVTAVPLPGHVPSVSEIGSAVKPEPGKGLSTTLNWTGQLQTDFAWFSQTPANMESVGDMEDGADFRRLRLGAFGEAFEQFNWRIEVDFALANRPSFLDNFVGITDLPYVDNIRVGNFFEPFSLERVTPNRFMTFLERSLIDEAFVPARNLGTMAFGNLAEERMSWAIGGFRTGSDEFADDVGDDGEVAVTGRLTGLLWYDEPSGGRYYAHLGGAYSFRDEDEDFVMFRARPEIRMRAFGEGDVPFFVNTGPFEARNHQLFGAEALWVHGPLSLQSEFVAVPVNRADLPDAYFYGGYVYASYVLTGEHRPYSKGRGIVDRLRPFENFFRVPTEKGVQMGLGAWEVAARLSYIDLNDREIEGGRLSEYTVGLNWYLNAYTRIQFNYIHSALNREPVGPSSADTYALRVGYDF